MYIRLEYSESSGHFHFATLNERGENTNGYVTLSSMIRSQLAEQFYEQLRQKFPDNTIGQNKNNLSFSKVQIEFLDFINKELETIRKAMNKKYLHRSRIYRKD